MAIDNEVLCAIKARRSTRKFTAEQITPEQLDTLLEAAIWAPSGGNSQSWLFTAIQREDALAKLNDVVKEGFGRYVPDDGYPGKLGVKEYARRDEFNFFYHAPTLIIASNKPDYENAMADCALALENIFLAARSIGLGTCYILLNAINTHCLAVFLPQNFVNSSLRAFAHPASSFPRLATKILASSVRVYDVKEYITQKYHSSECGV